jgi:hypothetical protein
LVSVISASALQGKNPFTPAPNGAIATKIGEFQIFYNNFFQELSCCNILKAKWLQQQPGFQIQFRCNFVQRLCEVQALITMPAFGSYGFCFV